MDPNWFVWAQFFVQLAPVILQIIAEIIKLPTTVEAKTAMLTNVMNSVLDKSTVPQGVRPAVHEFAQELAGFHQQALAKAALLK